jgi:DNA-binding transcriptional LysR family regulator
VVGSAEREPRRWGAGAGAADSIWAPPALDGLFLYYPSRRQTRAALKALIDFLRDERRGIVARDAAARAAR